MKSNDIATKETYYAKMQECGERGDSAGLWESLRGAIEANTRESAEAAEQSLDAKIEELKAHYDAQALAARGVRQLTTKELAYYQNLETAIRMGGAKQAIEGLDLAMPQTVINSVFDDLRTNHPLLSRINFQASAALTRIIVDKTGYQAAVWGDLCDEHIKEAAAGFEEIDITLRMLSAFMPVCRSMVDVGPVWLDTFVRSVLYEMIANGLELGIVAGSGNKEPIGMIRQIGDNVSVTGGVYPEKPKIAVNDLSISTLGNLMSLLAVAPSGKSRVVRDVILLVNPQDHYQKIMPATTVLLPGGYQNNVLPYPITIIPTVALARGNAVLGMANRYHAGAGMETGGRVEYSDHFRFLQNQRVYLAKTYANGIPLDNNSFLYLDISGMRPMVLKVEQATAPAPSADATLSDLKIGSLTLEPAFAAGTKSYTATTTNATNTITAFPADAGAEIEVLVNDGEIDNGTAATWQTGANTVTINVTAADGTSTDTYTVTVNKS